MAKVALAFDLGGTELRGALVERGGRILAFASAPTMARAGSEAVIGQIAVLASDLRAQWPETEVAGIGIGAPGPLDPKAGIVIAPPTLAGWHDVPLIEILGRQFEHASAAGKRRQCGGARRMAIRRRPRRRLAGLRYGVDGYRRRRHRRRPSLSRPARACRRDRPHDHHRRRRPLLLRRRRLLRGSGFGNCARAARHRRDGDGRRLDCSGGLRPMATFLRGMSSRPPAPETSRH